MKKNSILEKCRLNDSLLNKILGGEQVNYGCATGSCTFHDIYYSADSNENVIDETVTYDRLVRHSGSDKSPYNPCDSAKLSQSSTQGVNTLHGF